MPFSLSQRSKLRLREVRKLSQTTQVVRSPLIASHRLTDAKNLIFLYVGSSKPGPPWEAGSSPFSTSGGTWLVPLSHTTLTYTHILPLGLLGEEWGKREEIHFKSLYLFTDCSQIGTKSVSGPELPCPYQDPSHNLKKVREDGLACGLLTTLRLNTIEVLVACG